MKEYKDVKYIDAVAFAEKVKGTGVINSSFFAEMLEKEPPAQLPILSCEGMKMFHGVMRITPKNPAFKPIEKEADWLYKSEFDCWYDGWSSYEAEICERIR